MQFGININGLTGVRARMSAILGSLLRAALFLIYILPQPIQQFLGICIGLLWFDVLRIRRKTAIENVLKVFPEKTKAEATKMARTSLIHMGYTIIEIAMFPFLSEKAVKKLVVFPEEDQKRLRDSLKGNGAFVLSAHTGNGDVGGAGLCHYGFTVHLISKVFKSKWLNDFWFAARSKHGIKFISPRRSSYDIIKALKADELVIFVLDQYTGPPNGVVTSFFGIKTGTAMGPAILTRKTGSTVIGAYAFREKFGRHRIRITEEVPFVQHEDKDECIRINTENYNRLVEKMILDNPEQWMWVHRRWKQAW